MKGQEPPLNAGVHTKSGCFGVDWSLAALKMVRQVQGKRLSNHVGSNGSAGFVASQTGSPPEQSSGSTCSGSVDTNFRPLLSTTSSQSTFSRPFST
eukprot:4216126-Pleurochrysis_carterae.AAC.1